MATASKTKSTKKPAKRTKAARPSLLARIAAPLSSKKRKKNTSLLSRRSPLSGRLVIVVAAFVAAGGYFLIAHSFAAGNPPEIESFYAGMCIDDYQNKTVGTASSNKAVAVDLFKCNGSGAQSWTMLSDTNSKIMIHGQCLDVAGNSVSVGAKVDLYTCKTSNNANQLWTQNSNRQIIGKQSGLCLVPFAANNGSPLEMVPCNAGPSQQWRRNTYPPGDLNGGTANPGTPTSGGGGSNGGGSGGAGAGNGSASSTLTAEVTSGITGKCLDDFKNSSAIRAVVDLYNCNGSSAQKWTILNSGTIKINGLCLDVFQQGTKAGSKIELFTCNGGANQVWSYNTQNHTYTGKQSGLCLTAPSSTNGTQLVLGSCTGAANQVWFTSQFTGTVKTTGGGSGGTSGTGAPTNVALATYQVTSGIAGKCLDDLHDGTVAKGAKANPVVINSCNGTAAQKWSLFNGQVLHNGQCLDVAGASTKSKAHVDLYPCTGAANQKWNYTNNALVAPNTGFCLDDPSSTTKNLTQLQVYKCNKTSAQMWTFMTQQAVAGTAVAAATKVAANTFPIRGTGAVCIDATTSVDVNNCNGSSGQAWLAKSVKTQAGTAVAFEVNGGSNCLAITGAGVAQGARIGLQACSTALNGSGLFTADNGTLEAQSDTSLCVGTVADSLSLGTPLQLESCGSSSDAEQWAYQGTLDAVAAPADGVGK